ncbi:MAG: hypothetical protein SVX43_00395 [Cyanobacteriota bacterium]|nr:hypothetical protein [Cyanobacteriota bacterium]
MPLVQAFYRLRSLFFLSEIACYSSFLDANVPSIFSSVKEFELGSCAIALVETPLNIAPSFDRL